MTQKVQFVNLTPHKITFMNNDGSTIDILPSGTIVRVLPSKETVETIGDYPLVRRLSVGEKVADLPDPQPGVVYIVSAIVLTALELTNNYRDDVVAPATGPTDAPIRDEKGQVKAVKRFVGMVRRG